LSRRSSITSTSGAKPCFLSSFAHHFITSALPRGRRRQTGNLDLVVNFAPKLELPARNRHGHRNRNPTSMLGAGICAATTRI